MSKLADKIPAHIRWSWEYDSDSGYLVVRLRCLVCGSYVERLYPTKQEAPVLGFANAHREWEL